MLTRGTSRAGSTVLGYGSTRRRRDASRAWMRCGRATAGCRGMCTRVRTRCGRWTRRGCSGNGPTRRNAPQARMCRAGSEEREGTTGVDRSGTSSRGATRDRRRRGARGRREGAEEEGQRLAPLGDQARRLWEQRLLDTGLRARRSPGQARWRRAFRRD